MSADPLNLTARHSYSASGVANDRAVGIAEAAGGNGVTVTTKRPRHSAKPAQALSAATSKKNARRQLRGLAKLSGGYRPDLKKAALAKLSAIAKAQRVRAAAAKEAK
jgi:large subunit ribosomal protein L28e